MQQKNDEKDKGDPGKDGVRTLQSGRRKSVKQKQVGDETPNPLPDKSYSARQPSGDTTEASPQGESPVD